MSAAERAVEIYPISRGALAGSTQLENLARVYAVVGEKEKAREVADRLLSIPSWVTDYALRNSAYGSELEWDRNR